MIVSRWRPVCAVCAVPVQVEVQPMAPTTLSGRGCSSVRSRYHTYINRSSTHTPPTAYHQHRARTHPQKNHIYYVSTDLLLPSITTTRHALPESLFMLLCPHTTGCGGGCERAWHAWESLAPSRIESGPGSTVRPRLHPTLRGWRLALCHITGLFQTLSTLAFGPPIPP